MMELTFNKDLYRLPTQWTVPEDGNYQIECGGSRGGRDLNLDKIILINNR